MLVKNWVDAFVTKNVICSKRSCFSFHKRHLLEGSINLNHVFDRLFIGNHSHQINDGTVIRTGIICKKALL